MKVGKQGPSQGGVSVAYYRKGQGGKKKNQSVEAEDQKRWRGENTRNLEENLKNKKPDKLMKQLRGR